MECHSEFSSDFLLVPVDCCAVECLTPRNMISGQRCGQELVGAPRYAACYMEQLFQDASGQDEFYRFVHVLYSDFFQYKHDGL